MKDKINSLQVGSILIMIMMSCFMGLCTFALISKAGVDSLFSIGISFIYGIIILLLFFYINDYETKLSLRDKVLTVFGKKIGFIINILLIVLATTIGMTTLFNLLDFSSSQFLSETPIVIIGLAHLIIIVYVNVKGLETLSRLSLILLVISTLLHLIAVFGLIPSFNFENFKPILEYGWSRPVIGSFMIFLINIVPILLILIIPKDKITNNKRFKKVISLFYVIGIIFIFSVILFTLGNLGIYLASMYQYPEYVVLKRVSLFNFLDRIENIVSIQWGFSSFISISFAVYFISNMIKFDNKSKVLPVIIYVIMLLSSIYLFKNSTSFNKYSINLYPYFLLLFFVLFIIIGIAIFLKKKIAKKKTNSII